MGDVMGIWFWSIDGQINIRKYEKYTQPVPTEKAYNDVLDIVRKATDFDISGTFRDRSGTNWPSRDSIMSQGGVRNLYDFLERIIVRRSAKDIEQPRQTEKDLLARELV